MWWKYMIEALFVMALLTLGVSFWSIIKSPSHLKKILKDTKVLREFLDFLGREKLINESKEIETSVSSFGIIIESWEKAHIGSLKHARNMVLFFSLILIATSYFIGSTYLFANVVIFFLPLLFPIVTSAKNNNMTHIHTIMLNIYKWYLTDQDGCLEFCTLNHPELNQLYEIVKELK